MIRRNILDSLKKYLNFSKTNISHVLVWFGDTGTSEAWTNLPLSHDASSTYKKEEWRTGLDNRVIMLWGCVTSRGERWFFLKRNLWFSGSGKCGLDEHIMTHQGRQALKRTHFMTRMYPAYMTTRIKLSHLTEAEENSVLTLKASINSADCCRWTFQLTKQSSRRRWTVAKEHKQAC